MTSLLLVEDHAVFAEALVRVLHGKDGFEVVKVVDTAEKALLALPELEVDLALVDVSLPRMSGIELVVELRSNGYFQPMEDGMRHLWSACAGQSPRTLVEPDGFVEVAPATYRFVVEPASGPSNERKLVGCLQDLTIKHLLGKVVSTRDIPPE